MAVTGRQSGNRLVGLSLPCSLFPVPVPIPGSEVNPRQGSPNGSKVAERQVVGCAR